MNGEVKKEKRAGCLPRILCMTLASLMLAFCLGGIAPAAHAADTDVKEPIQVGNDVYATLDNYGTLTISGNGEMWDFALGDSSREGWFYDYKDEINAVVFEEGVTRVGSYAFLESGHKNNYSGLRTVTSVTFSSTIDTIGEGAFRNLTALRSITIPGTVRTVEERAFYETYYLTSLKLNEGLEVIGDYAFYETSLTGVNIPGTVEIIGEYAFNDSLLKSATINEGTKIIKKYAFNGNVSIRFNSRDVVIMEGAVDDDDYATFTCYKGSTADVYAKNHEIAVKYIVNKPEKPAVTSKNRKLIISCDVVSEADGYKVRCSRSKSMKKAVTGYGQKAVISKLKRGKKYYVQVCAYSEYEDGDKVYGPWSDTISIIIR